MGTLVRAVLIALFAVAVLLLITLTLPVEGWRSGEPDGPRLTDPAAQPRWPRPVRLWVDTDAACGHGPRTDPDDCLALLFLAHAPEVEVAGISTVFGNAALEVTDSITRALVSRIQAGGRRPPVLRGAARPIEESSQARGAARSTAADSALARALEDGPLVVLALGPLTNLATTLRHRADLRAGVLRVVAVMGRRKGHLFHPVEGGTAPSFLGHGPVFRDFNFAKDPEAALALLDMDLPLTLVPYEAAREMVLTGADLDRMAAGAGASRWVADRSRGWLDYWEREIGRDGFYPFDLVAAGYVVGPEVAWCARVNAWVENDAGVLGWFGRRGLFVRPPADRPPANGGAAPAVYCPDLAEQGSDWLRTRLVSPPSPRPAAPPP